MIPPRPPVAQKMIRTEPLVHREVPVNHGGASTQKSQTEIVSKKHCNRPVVWLRAGDGQSNKHHRPLVYRPAPRSPRFYRDGLGWQISKVSNENIAFIPMGGIVLALYRAASAGGGRCFPGASGLPGSRWRRT